MLMIALKWYKEGKREKMLNQLQTKEDDIYIHQNKTDMNESMYCLLFILQFSFIHLI